MIKKLSLFELQATTLQHRLRNADITNQTINKHSITIYIDRIDPTMYCFFLDSEQTQSDKYFITTIYQNEFKNINDLIHYILNDLYELFVKDNENLQLKKQQENEFNQYKIENITLKIELLRIKQILDNMKIAI